MAFSASEAAFEGFSIVRREPKAVIGWSVCQLIVASIVTLAIFPFARPLMALQSAQVAGERPTPAQAAAILEPALSLIAVMIPLEIVVISLLSAAVYRTVLRPEEKGFARLRLGGDELRLAILWIELGLMFAAVGFVVLVAVLVVFGAVAAMAKMNSMGGVVAAVIACYLVVLAVMAWLSVRFSLAAPATFATRKVQLFSAWRLTKGRFWPLFGCYLLTFIFMMIIVMVQLSLAAIVNLAMAGGSLTQAARGMMSPDYSSLAAFLTPARIVSQLVYALLAGVYLSVAFAPAAAAYRDITASTPG